MVGVAEPGDVLGLHATITGERHELTAETLQPSQLNFVGRYDFFDMRKLTKSIGTSRETVTRLLTKFRNDRLAQLDGHTLLIRNKLALEKLVASL